LPTVAQIQEVARWRFWP